MKTMQYKGYAAKIEYSDEDECFVGSIAGIKDMVVFHGESVQEIKTAFYEAVDFYLETCAQRGELPNKPYSGKIMLHLDPEIHAQVAIQAEVQGKSFNQFVGDVLRRI